MSRHFVIESSGASKIIKESPLQVLVQLGLHVTKLDQCMYGAEQENKRIRKNIMFVYDCPQTGLDSECYKIHSHLQLRGTGPKGSRTAAAAKYPTKLCDSILDSIAKMRTTSQDEGRIKPSVRFAMPENNSDDSKYDQVTQRLQELRLIATQHGLTDLFQTLVDPWIEDAPGYRSDSKTWPCSSIPNEFNTQTASKASETSSDLSLIHI